MPDASADSVHKFPSNLSIEPLRGRTFGATIRFSEIGSEQIVLSCCERSKLMQAELNQAGGLLVLKGLHDLSNQPELMVRLSRIFGPEVENYHQTLTSKNFFHNSVPELLVLSNLPPCSYPPPPLPDPPLTDSGHIPVQFPHRREWHTDQSYRRPPPDVSLLYAVTITPANQGQTIYADCTSAYDMLNTDMQQLITGLNGIHAPSWIGRSEAAVKSGEPPKKLLPHQYPQTQPLVRVHPDTGRKSLYLCEPGQMDFMDGPIAGLQTGPDGEGAHLLYTLLAHATQPRFVHVHRWEAGDLVIGDNRCLLHTATWYDVEKYSRVMWRTTVMGNAGAEYHGEAKSWISEHGDAPMQGLERF